MRPPVVHLEATCSGSTRENLSGLMGGYQARQWRSARVGGEETVLCTCRERAMWWAREAAAGVWACHRIHGAGAGFVRITVLRHGFLGPSLGKA